MSLPENTNWVFWKWKSVSNSVVSDSLWPHGLYSPRNSPGQNTGVGSLSLLQGIFPTQGLNRGFPHCRWIFFYQLSHKGSPRILEWVAYLFSRGSSQPRNRTQVSCIAGGFFTIWATRNPKNTGMGSLSVLQENFPTQVSCIVVRFFTIWATGKPRHCCSHKYITMFTLFSSNICK